MSPVEFVEIAEEEADSRLDRWFKRHYPGLSHGRLEKLLRTGQIRVDGRRARASHRLSTGERLRIPPLAEAVTKSTKPLKPTALPDAVEIERARSWVLYRDADVIVINKPPGLAVQGGSGVTKHLDALLDGLRYEATERPRLVHRLDRDTSGVLVLARTAAAARHLTAAFRHKDVRKVYWALVVGVPRPARGTIETPLGKRPGAGGEKTTTDASVVKTAITDYTVVEAAGRRAAWLALSPLTGRTHQLRAHCAEALDRPIVGDGKYGGARAFLSVEGIAPRLHLHARAISLPAPADPRGHRHIRVIAPLPPHMKATWRLLGFDPDDPRDPFTPFED